MQKLNRLLITACSLSMFMAAAGFVLPPPTYGQPEGEDEVDSPGQGDEHRADPCEHLPDAPGEANGHEKKCPDLGSSGGEAGGDFNGDGFADLAVGTPFEDILVTKSTSVADAGAVTIIYGSSSGLVATSTTVPNSQIWHQNVSGVLENAEANDQFGAALVAGDFNGDGFSDLAVAVPGERDSSGTVVGAVHVLLGSSSGLTATGDQLLLASSFSTKFRSSGFSLVWANFNGDQDADGDPFGDLAIEALGPNVTPQVLVLRGSAGGLSATGSQLLTFPQCDVAFCGGDVPIVDLVLAAGDFSGDGRAELVVGAPRGPGGTVQDAGNVRILRSESSGLTLTGSQFLHQDVNGVPEVAESGDQFGAALAVGDFDGDGQLDLTVGVPGEDNGKRIFFASTGNVSGVLEPNSIANGGAVNVFLTSVGPQILFEAQFRADENGQLLLGDREVEPGDGNATALAAGDFDDDGFSDLAVGGPGETLGSAAGAGSATIFYGSAAGFEELDDWQFWTESALGGTSAAGDNFGAPLSAWNFGRNHSVATVGPVQTADLAIGVPSKDFGSTRRDAGAVRVIYGFTTGLATSTQAYTPGPLETPRPGPSQFLHQDLTGIPDQNETGDRFGSALY